MLIESLYFGGGLITGTAGTLTFLFIPALMKKFRGRMGENEVEDLLTMEQVSKKAGSLLRSNTDIDAVAVALYDRDNVPAEVTNSAKLPESADFILVMVTSKDDKPIKVCAVYLAKALEAPLKIALEEGHGVLKIVK